jgi:hypothetical protein
MYRASAIGRLLMLWVAVLSVGLVVPSCSRNDNEVKSVEPIFVRLMREMPEARYFVFYDLDVTEIAFPKEKTDKGAYRLPYGDLRELLNLPPEWEKELRAIIPERSRGFFVKVWEFPGSYAHPDFYSVLYPKAWDIKRFEALLKKNGFTSRKEESSVLWAGMGHSGYSEIPIQLRISSQWICLGNFDVAGSVTPNRNFGQLPRAKELAQLMYPDACNINIDTPSSINSIFGEIHEGFALAMRSNMRLDAVLNSYADEETAGRAQSWHVRKSPSKKGPVQKGRILIWETKELLRAKGGGK